jgi:8-oxo-dGTP pyrophosphatase MutT (NUDIX family)
VTSDARAAALVGALVGLHAADTLEDEDRRATVQILETLARPFDEDAQPAHVTASAFVLSTLGVVLHRHRHLGIWVQPGGHVEPSEQPGAAAVRETREETGLAASHLEPPLLAHVNVHHGPRSHHHFDCRWLLVAHATELEPAEGESTEVSWFLPDAALERCEPGLRGGLEKVFSLARGLGLAEVASWQA